VVGTAPSDYSKPLHYTAGDTIPIQTGVIVDKNGNAVPDGTVVSFLIDSRSANGALEQIDTQTIDGIASTTYTIPSIGSLELRVEADPALTSQILRLDITSVGGVVTSYEPTTLPEGNQETEPAEITAPTETNTNILQHEQGKLSILDWFLSTAVIFVVCLLFNWFARKILSMKWIVGITLGLALGGNLAYAYIAIGLPGASSIIREGGTGSTLLVVILGMAVGLAACVILYLLEKRKKKFIVKQ